MRPHPATTGGKQRLAVVRDNKQLSLAKRMPAGNYSGIAHVAGNSYILADDKSPTDGFTVCRIDIDTLTGRIVDAAYETFMSSGTANRDMEGIAFFPTDSTVFVSGEADNRIREYSLDGKMTGRELRMPDVFGTATKNYGIESLTYNAATHRFWATTESTLPSDGVQASNNKHTHNILRLQSFSDALEPSEMYFYKTDAPTTARKASTYAFGVSDICALDDGRLIVLEREFFVPKRKIGAWVRCKLYVADPSQAQPNDTLSKTELLQFRTRLTLFKRNLANYEGMCLGPELADGSRVLLLVSDSQNRYKGILKDWLKTIVIH